MSAGQGEKVCGPSAEGKGEEHWAALTGRGGKKKIARWKSWAAGSDFQGLLPFFFFYFSFSILFSKRAFEQKQLKQKQNNSTKTIILRHECTIKFTKLMINFIFYKNYLFTKLNAHKNT